MSRVGLQERRAWQRFESDQKTTVGTQASGVWAARAHVFWAHGHRARSIRRWFPTSGPHEVYDGLIVRVDPITSQQRSISQCTRFSRLVLTIWDQCSRGKLFRRSRVNTSITPAPELRCAKDSARGLLDHQGGYGQLPWDTASHTGDFSRFFLLARPISILIPVSTGGRFETVSHGLILADIANGQQLVARMAIFTRKWPTVASCHTSALEN